MTLTRLDRLRSYVEEGIATFHPAYFAMSMATGIVSLASSSLGLHDLALGFFWINIVAYGFVWAVTLERARHHWRSFLADWTSHQRGPGFFTSVAATCVLGTQFVVQRGMPEVAFGLWILALVLWLICTYTIFVALSIGEEKPSLADGINGGWLVAVVATQAVCVLGCHVLPERVADRDVALFFLTSFWLCGGMLYMWMISLIFYRYTFFRFSPSDLMPPYWINMGAVAISTLAGTMLVAASGASSLMSSLRPFVQGVTILYWATATWWIPMLVALGVWRHAVRRVRFVYDPLYWGLVFPLGMYCVATYRLIETFDLPFLVWIARAFVVIALIAWMFTFSGLMTRLLYLALLAVRAVTPPLAVGERGAAGVSAIDAAGVGRPSHGGSA